MDDQNRPLAAHPAVPRSDDSLLNSPARTRTNTHYRLIAGVALLGFLLSVALLYPGQFPFDSAYQLWQARTGQFSNLSPVTMPAVWAVLLKFSDDPASLLIANLALFWLGSTLHGMALNAALWIRLLVTTLPGLWIPNLPQLAHLLSDTHLAGVLMLASGSLAFTIASRRKHFLWLAVIALIHAGSIRHNAILAMMPLGFVVCSLLLADRQQLGTARTVFACLALCAASMLSGFVLDRNLVRERVTVWPTVALWDIAAVSVDSGELLLPRFTHGEDLTIDELVETAAFDPTSNTALFSKTRSGMRSGLHDAFDDNEIKALRGAWLSAVIDHPFAYLSHRLRTLHLLTSRRGDENPSAAYYINRISYRDNPELPIPWMPLAQKKLYEVAERLQTTWAFSAQPYLLTGAIAFIIGWRRRETRMRPLVLALSASALLYAASFFLLAPSAELRYLTWPMIAGPLALGLLLERRQHAASSGF